MNWEIASFAAMTSMWAWLEAESGKGGDYEMNQHRFQKIMNGFLKKIM